MDRKRTNERFFHSYIRPFSISFLSVFVKIGKKNSFDNLLVGSSGTVTSAVSFRMSGLEISSFPALIASIISISYVGNDQSDREKCVYPKCRVLRETASKHRRHSSIICCKKG